MSAAHVAPPSDIYDCLLLDISPCRKAARRPQRLGRVRKHIHTRRAANRLYAMPRVIINKIYPESRVHVGGAAPAHTQSLTKAGCNHFLMWWRTYDLCALVSRTIFFPDPPLMHNNSLEIIFGGERGAKKGCRGRSHITLLMCQ